MGWELKSGLYPSFQNSNNIADCRQTLISGDAVVKSFPSRYQASQPYPSTVVSNHSFVSVDGRQYARRMVLFPRQITPISEGRGPSAVYFNLRNRP
jgi:hypothetical protein